MELPDFVREAMRRLEERGHEAYLVGGCVRDLMRGACPSDWDIATDALPEETAACFPRVVMTGERFGTVMAMVRGTPLEITTYRREGRYSDRRRPDTVVYTSSLTEDLSRRDFTVNAMAYRPEEGVVDPFGGREDLEKRLLRCVGVAAERFSEDALRILRLFRFMAQLDFRAEEGTLRAARDCAPLLREVARERVTQEMTKLLAAPGRFLALEAMEASGALREALGVGAVPGALRGYGGDAVGAWALLLEEVPEALGGLRLPAAQKKAILALWGRKEAPEGLAETRVLLHELGEENAERLLWARGKAPGRLFEEAKRLPHEGKDLDLDARALPYRGRKVGEVLTALLYAVMRGEVENEEGALLRHAKERFGDGEEG